MASHRAGVATIQFQIADNVIEPDSRPGGAFEQSTASTDNGGIRNGAAIFFGFPLHAVSFEQLIAARF
jgi:hypothetical protein